MLVETGVFDADSERKNPAEKKALDGFYAAPPNRKRPLTLVNPKVLPLRSCHQRTPEAALKGFERFDRLNLAKDDGCLIVEVYEEPTVHRIQVDKMFGWLKSSGRNPAEETKKRRLRELVKLTPQWRMQCIFQGAYYLSPAYVPFADWCAGRDVMGSAVAWLSLELRL